MEGRELECCNLHFSAQVCDLKVFSGVRRERGEGTSIT